MIPFYVRLFVYFETVDGDAGTASLSPAGAAAGSGRRVGPMVRRFGSATGCAPKRATAPPRRLRPAAVPCSGAPSSPLRCCSTRSLAVAQTARC